MKYLSLFLILIIMSCNSTNKVSKENKVVENKVDSAKMISEGYLAGEISLSDKEGDCPVTILIDNKEGNYYLDPINISEDFKTNNEKVWIKFRPLRQMNRCEKASPIELTDIKKNN